MASVSAIREALRVRLATIAGQRAYAQIPDNIEPPVLVVAPRGGAFDATMNRDSDESIFQIIVAVSPAESRTAQLLLDEYLAGSGAKSVKAAVEADETLGGVVDFARVASWDSYGDVTIAGVQYFGVRFLVEVLADGA